MNDFIWNYEGAMQDRKIIRDLYRGLIRRIQSNPEAHKTMQYIRDQRLHEIAWELFPGEHGGEEFHYPAIDVDALLRSMAFVEKYLLGTK